MFNSSTLHRLGIQAFEPVLVEGRAIKLHPLACTAFNADFDGDQMAVHVPLSAEAQAEARMLMLAANNLLKPSDGKPVTVPTQDMVIGSYYLTMIKGGEPGCPTVEKDAQGNEYTRYNIYRDKDEAMMAYQEGSLGLHSECLIRFSKEVDGEVHEHLVKTTIGRVIFNAPVPQDLGFVDRSDPENEFVPEISFVVKKKQLGQIVEKCIRVHGVAVASKVLDALKAQGYKYSTISGTTVAVVDALIPEKKKEYLDEAEKRVDEITTNYNYGLITNEERSSAVIKAWEDCTNKVSHELTSNFDGAHNPIHMMVDSGARGSTSQLRQLAGMRGLIANTAGKTIEVPIRANYREGLNILEYFISSRGARKGLADTALRTADSGYLTRRLVDVSQDVIIRDQDCGCHDGIIVSKIMDGNRVLEPLEERSIWEKMRKETTIRPRFFLWQHFGISLPGYGQAQLRRTVTGLRLTATEKTKRMRSEIRSVDCVPASLTIQPEDTAIPATLKKARISWIRNRKRKDCSVISRRFRKK